MELVDMNFDYSSFLFCPNGSPLNFYIPPHRLKSSFRTLIEKGGGNVSNKDTPDCLRLLMPGIACKFGEMIASEFIVDSIHKNRLQKKGNYIVPKGSTYQKNDASEESSSDHRSSKFLSKGRSHYTVEEDESILKYLLENKRYLACLGQQVWVKAEKDKVTSHTWQSMKARFRLITARLDQYTHLDPAIKDLKNFLQERGKVNVGEKSPDSHRHDDADKIPKKNVNFYRGVEDSSSEEEEVCRPRPKKKLKICNKPSRDLAVRPQADACSGAWDDGETVAPRTNRLPNVGESNAETVSNPDTIPEALELSRPIDSQGSNNSTVDSILLDLRSKSDNLKEFLKRHEVPESGTKKPAVLKCVAVERKYEPCKCHPAKIDRGRDGIVEPLRLSLGEPSEEKQVPLTTEADFTVDKEKAELVRKRLDIPSWVLDSALFFNNCNLEDAIFWLLNDKATRSGKPSYNHKDDNLILRGSPDDLNDLESRLGKEALGKRREFLQYLSKQKR